MIRSDKYDLNEENSDPDKKYFAKEQKYAQREKKALWIIFTIFLLVWFFFL